ncbi:DASH complex subunit Dad2-domain-containing protein [Aspergillus coremiiformis]|uniref:DASH complex subunit DAD2 n=1 Tax=Aspergillus coremiiformis TaxID=138285 RepID=A0A5N6YSZ4_9EURO|nr:DASH complex subunit Dad2-domain-containing protein [Aspergillus coremiiformis]
MAHTSRLTSIFPAGSSTGSSFRQPSTHHGAPQQQSSVLAARIASKKAELNNLKQLRDMSGTLAMQMQVLEQKIRTLNDGTEGVALVLSNWDNVLQSISMASTKTVNIRRPTEQESNTGSGGIRIVDSDIPATLVRIPAEQAAGGTE